MPLTIGLNPAPQVVAHDPLGRAMSEEQRLRLREQLSPPVEETLAKEKIVEHRDDRREQDTQRQRQDDDENSPGSIIDTTV